MLFVNLYLSNITDGQWWHEILEQKTWDNKQLYIQLCILFVYGLFFLLKQRDLRKGLM